MIDLSAIGAQDRADLHRVAAAWLRLSPEARRAILSATLEPHLCRLVEAASRLRPGLVKVLTDEMENPQPADLTAQRMRLVGGMVNALADEHNLDPADAATPALKLVVEDQSNPTK